MEAVDYCYYKGSIVLCSSVVISAFISKTLNATPFKEKKQLKSIQMHCLHNRPVLSCKTHFPTLHFMPGNLQFVTEMFWL